MTCQTPVEQLGLALRYVKDNKPEERLVSFIACDSVSGNVKCTTIFVVWLALDLMLNYVVHKLMMGQAAYLAI